MSTEFCGLNRPLLPRLLHAARGHDQCTRRAGLAPAEDLDNCLIQEEEEEEKQQKEVVHRLA